ncbi:MAG: ankyrin repeat domain-containing protein [Gallionella sp.]|nr:ankyrin repeat domain-containing protein [Gallionella sp.]
MDIKKIVEQIKSSRNFKMAAMAVGVLAIAAAGGAYYFLVYLPEMESEAAAAKPPVAAKPKPVPAAAAAKPATPQPAASGVPAVAPVKPQPEVAQAASAPIPGKTDEPAKPDIAVEKIEPKKDEAATRPEQEAKPQQAAKPDKKMDVPALREDRPQSQEAIPAAEPVPVEPAPVAAESPPPQRGGITPKYNDIMTAVLRGDREAAKELLDLGWWVDKPSDDVTPLMAAVMNRDTQMVQLLLEYGAEPTLKALELARKNKDAATAALLEQKGAR